MVVVPDRGGERENPLPDPDRDAGHGASAVAFQVQLSLECLVDRLDDLAQRFEQGCARSRLLALAGLAQ